MKLIQLTPNDPWLQEENRYQFYYRGYPCLILRNHMGAFCGYVGITEKNRFYGIPMEKLSFSVHGGITFAGYGDDASYGGHHFCRPSKDKDGNQLYWIGFDCAHKYDYCPAVAHQLKEAGVEPSLYLPKDKTYRTVNYVIGELQFLVDQIIDRGE